MDTGQIVIGQLWAKKEVSIKMTDPREEKTDDGRLGTRVENGCGYHERQVRAA
jgi:hypothetical protein